MQAQRSAVDALGVALCGIGAAVVFSPHEGTTELLLTAGALYGMHRVLASRAALWAIAAVVLAWLLVHFWDLVPVKHPYELMNEHPTIYATPSVLLSLVWAALLLAIPIIGRQRTGTGLMIVTLAAVATSALAGLALRAFDDKESTGAIVLGSMARGWGVTATTLVAACFVAVAVSPAIEPLPRRLGASIGVAGGALLAATFAGMPESVSGGHEGAMVLPVLAMALAWILSAVGLAGLARSGGGRAAWVAMALVIAQVLVLPAGLALGESGQSFRASISVVLELGFFGIGLAAVSAPSIALQRARGLAGVLALVAVHGAWLTLLRYTTKHVEPAERGLSALSLYTYPVATLAAALWAACLAYLVAPPRAK